MSIDGFTFGLVRASAALAAWLITYAVHSTMLIVCALTLSITSARIAPTAHAPRELLWKCALYGALVTATAQSFGLRLAGTSVDISRRVETLVWATPGASLQAAAIRYVPVVLIVAWSAFAIRVLYQVFTSAARARAALGVRRPVNYALVLRDFAEIAVRLGVVRQVVLTMVERVASPVVIGQSEICVPERVVHELPSDERRSVLAHELAHVARHDAAWLVCTASLESLFFFQPLNRIGRMHLIDETEFLVDDLAIQHRRSPRATTPFMSDE